MSAYSKLLINQDGIKDMIYSMTGYGSAKGTVVGLELSIELKSVNNRYLDTSVRLPRSYIFAEDGIKSLVQKHVTRGKVDVFVSVDSSKSNELVISVNEPLASGYITAMRSLCESFGVKDDISASVIARMPDVLITEKKEADRQLIADGIAEILETALIEYDKMRACEGEKLREDICSRLDFLEKATAVVEKRSPETVNEYRSKLEQRMKEVLDNVSIDENRILAEAAIFADRVAVAEETVRLRSHIEQLRAMLRGGSPVGRKLDFLIQELNRETNTIGSKCNDVEISKLVVDMKAEIEKIREQVQNIE